MKTFTFNFTLSLLVVSSLAFAQNGGPDFKSPCGMTSAQFEWPAVSAQGFYNLDFFLTVNKEAPNYYWAQQFYFVDGQSGYMGLQTSARFNGEQTKVAIFSIWDAKNASKAPNGMSEFFGHEGSGYSCRIPFDWKEGTQYRIRLWQLGKEENGDTWWGAWAKDIQNDTEEFIGKILVPASWKGLKSTTINFVEYWGMQDGQRHPCSDIPYVNTTFAFPSMNNGTVQPGSVGYQAYGDCASIAKIGATGSNLYQVETGIGH